MGTSGSMPDVIRSAKAGRVAAATATGDTPSFTVSFGLTDSSAAASFGQLVGIADQALMTAKQHGRNQVIIAGHEARTIDTTTVDAGRSQPNH